MLLKSALAAGLILLAPATAGAAPAVITQPDWLEKPSAEDLSEHYPAIAASLGLNGVATVSCSVNAEGLLVDCITVSERPADLGFGRAAIAMTSRFRMRPMTVNGKAVEGGAVRIPLRFALPQEEHSPPPPAPVSEEAGRQALRFVDSLKTVESSLAAFDRSAKSVEGLGEDAAPRDVRIAAADASRRAAKTHREDLRQAYARAVAAVFSEAEMTAMADFGAKAGDLMRDNEALSALQGQIAREYYREAVSLAHDAYCAGHTCASPADAAKVWRAADPREAGRIDNPQWAEQPSEAQVASLRPRIAGLVGLTGLVRLTCKVAQAGTLERCQMDEEAPGGVGYGPAALALAGGYRLGAIQLAADGAGRKVTVRVGFPAEVQPPPFKAPAGAEKSLALARQLTQIEQAGRTSRRETELEMANLASRPPRGVDRKTYDAALEAYRTASHQALTRYLEQSVNVWASTFTEAQLTTFAAFDASPAGQAEREREEEWRIAMSGALAYVSEKITADARTAFCKDRECLPPQPTAASSEASARKP
jgi:TonB family protein